MANNIAFQSEPVRCSVCGRYHMDSDSDNLGRCEDCVEDHYFGPHSEAKALSLCEARGLFDDVEIANDAIVWGSKAPSAPIDELLTRAIEELEFGKMDSIREMADYLTAEANK